MVDLTGNIIVSIGTIATIISLAIYVGRKTQSIEGKVAAIPRIAQLTEEHCVRITRGEMEREILRRDVNRVEGDLRELGMLHGSVHSDVYDDGYGECDYATSIALTYPIPRGVVSNDVAPTAIRIEGQRSYGKN